ncbi:MAG: S-adenosylmethionine:tRNA ribosyltransferase-isomerase [bacterium]
MNIINDLSISDFDYVLPKEKIALFPTENREESKLLFGNCATSKIEHYKFKDITNLLEADSLLVVNNTKVIAARILVRKSSGGKAEILCTEPVSPSNDPQIAMKTRGWCEWSCIVGGRAIGVGTILKPEMLSTPRLSVGLHFNTPASTPRLSVGLIDDSVGLIDNSLGLIGSIDLSCEVIQKDGMEAIVKFSWQPENLTFADILTELGKIPLPPYIDRDNVESDKNRYQTVYAKNDGSVAAPTAGLHFTDSVLSDLAKKNITRTNLTLHVGPGTFKPVSDEGIANHTMHEEQIFVSRHTLLSLFNQYKSGNKVIAVGTTSLRTLETLYQVGTNLYNNDYSNFQNHAFTLEQWEAYEDKTFPAPADAFKAILDYMDENKLDILTGKTKLFVLPGYNIKTIDGLITNFHLPKSTLIMLVSAFLGGEYWKEIYKTALENDYRFLSYGDSSLLIR